MSSSVPSLGHITSLITGVADSGTGMIDSDAALRALEEHYYQILEMYRGQLEQTDSALVWLSFASPSSSFSLAVPRPFRNPKAMGGSGGYADAFKRLGLSLREKELKSGHFHLWHCDCRTVNLRALQAALRRRCRENPNFNENQAMALMNNTMMTGKRNTSSSSSSSYHNPTSTTITRPPPSTPTSSASPSPAASHAVTIAEAAAGPPPPSMVNMNTAALAAASAFNSRMNANRLHVAQSMMKREEARKAPPPPPTTTATMVPVVAAAAPSLPLPMAAPLIYHHHHHHLHPSSLPPSPYMTAAPMANETAMDWFAAEKEMGNAPPPTAIKGEYTIHTTTLPPNLPPHHPWMNLSARPPMMNQPLPPAPPSVMSRGGGGGGYSTDMEVEYHVEKHPPSSLKDLRKETGNEKLSMHATSTHALQLSSFTQPHPGFPLHTKPHPPPAVAYYPQPIPVLPLPMAKPHAMDEEVAFNLLSLATAANAQHAS